MMKSLVVLGGGAIMVAIAVGAGIPGVGDYQPGQQFVRQPGVSECPRSLRRLRERWQSRRPVGAQNGVWAGADALSVGETHD